MLMMLPFAIGLAVATILYVTVGWWGFWVIFPWIGFSISLGVYLMRVLPTAQKNTGRRVAMLMILPVLLIFVPVANQENFQLEGIVLLLTIGFFSKGVIHYAIAKVFGPLIWGRGFCGWACWTAAVLEWLPVRKVGKIPESLKKLRFVSLGISVVFPLMLIFFLSYDVQSDYLYKSEMVWMFVGNAVYYVIGIPMAFIFKDKRAFCKIACPISLVMKVPTQFSLIKISPSGEKCVKCSKCSAHCPMDIDVMSYISQGKKVTHTECILCMECKIICPVQAIK